MSARPSVSVVVPFVGDLSAAQRLASYLQRLELRRGDEVIVADNTPDGMPEAVLSSRVHIVRAAAERSAYHARNAGAAQAANDWILFLDAD